MEIKTKFNIGDYAWCMKNNRPIKVRITSNVGGMVSWGLDTDNLSPE